MPLDDSQEGDHLERGGDRRGGDSRRAVVSNIPERQGVGGQAMRWVLLIGIAAVVGAFLIMLMHALGF